MKEPRPIAVLASDTHFGDQVPLARAETREEWYQAQESYCEQLRKIAGDLPIFVAGDLLHRWNEPAELVNLLIRHMPHVYAVAGNHDLPNHSLEQITRSAFWTLVEAGKVSLLKAKPSTIGRMLVYGFSCGGAVTPRPEKHKGLGVVVVHDMIYANPPFPGVDPEKQQCAWMDRKFGYDVMHFGDNHRPLRLTRMGVEVFNGGAFICRRADERRHKPRIGILHSDGTVTEEFLDVSGDKWVDALSDGGRDEEPVGHDFADALLETSGVTDDFADAVAHYARRHKDEITKGTRRLLVRIMEESRE